jgi:hypothetical protein
MAFDLQAGETIRRTELHEKFGGRRQGGISPSRVTPNVFLITAPERGSAFGYIYDGLADDGFFHYTGEGQVGDQVMTQGNRAVRDHETEGRALHVFEARGTTLEYVGEFRYHDDYQADAPEVDNGPIRKVIVFRLEQITGTPTDLVHNRIDRLGTDTVREVAVEQSLTERMLIEGRQEPYEAERREQKLVLELSEYLGRHGHEVCRLQLRPSGEPAALFCDLYDKTTNTIYESKANVTRPATRMAIGQLADYARLLNNSPRRALLLPEKPRPDLVALAESQGIEVVWQQDGVFPEYVLAA